MDGWMCMDGWNPPFFFFIIFTVSTVFFEWMEHGWKFSEFQPFWKCVKIWEPSSKWNTQSTNGCLEYQAAENNTSQSKFLVWCLYVQHHVGDSKTMLRPLVVPLVRHHVLINFHFPPHVRRALRPECVPSPSTSTVRYKSSCFLGRWIGLGP